MSWTGFLEGLVEVGTKVVGHAQFLAFVKSNRAAAMESIANTVAQLAPAAIDRFEANFVEQAALIVDPVARARAMELYAWLKLQETVHYGAFRGFTTGGDSLS